MELVNSKLRTTFDFLLVLVFVIVLIIPIVVQFFSEEQTISSAEKRELASFPSLTWEEKTISQFPRDFDTWLQDHFGLRQSAISLYHFLKVAVFRNSPIPERVLLGRSPNWLYLADKGALHSYLRDIPFRKEELESLAKHALDAHLWSKEHGAAYAWLLVPRKANFYPEHLPRWLQRRGSHDRLDIFMQHMEQHPQVMVLDGRPALDAAKTEHRLYYPDDSHWNLRGVYAVYPWLIEQLQTQVPELNALAPERIRFVTEASGHGDLARLLDMNDYFKQEVQTVKILAPSALKVDSPGQGLVIPPGVRMTTFERPGATGLRAVVFSDSFGDQFHRILAETFQRVVFVRGSYFWKELIEAEKPHLVLRVNVESTLFSKGELKAHYAKAKSKSSSRITALEMGFETAEVQRLMKRPWNAARSYLSTTQEHVHRGTYGLVVHTGTALWDGLRFGVLKDDKGKKSVLPFIRCQANSNYRLSLQLKGIRGYEKLPMVLHVGGDDNYKLADVETKLSDQWTPVSLRFTTGPTTRYLGFELVKLRNPGKTAFAVDSILLQQE